MDFLVEESIRKRRSVRTYDKGRTIENAVREQVMAYAAALDNPLGPKVAFKLIDKRTAPHGEKLGTYGIIKGAELYVGASVPNKPYALESLGYDFEKLVLYLTDMGLGTCWLGGTFNRSAFADAMELKDGELFPIVSPVGYPAARLSLTEKIMRAGAKADQRLPWNQLFYREDFRMPLSQEEAGAYRGALEMVRLAPSAVNRQPWRVVLNDGAFHFFQANVSESDESGYVDMHRIDMGIAICHFHLMAQEKGLGGRLERLKELPFSLPERMAYIISWIPEIPV